MSDLRKAAELVIEAHDNRYGDIAHDAAVDQLRQALAQSEQIPDSKQSYLDGLNNGIKTERERCAKIALSGTEEPVQVATLKILRKERERIAANIMEIEAKLKEKNVG